jgi:hypothetical protein
MSPGLRYANAEGYPRPFHEPAGLSKSGLDERMKLPTLSAMLVCWAIFVSMSSLDTRGTNA